MYPQQPAAPVYYNSSSGGGKKIFINVLLTIFLIAALVFGFWAFTGRQDYKNNSDKKAAAAVDAAKANLAKQVQDQFDKQNTKKFQGSPTYGSISFDYPKTWSAYVDSTNSNEPINGYFHPDVVPGTQGKTAYALRVEVLSTDYSQIQQQFSSQITQGTLKSKAYVPPKMQGVANVVPGTYLTGKINQQDQSQSGSMVVIKVRDKTLEIYSESPDFMNDFNNVVLASLTFAP